MAVVHCGVSVGMMRFKPRVRVRLCRLYQSSSSMRCTFFSTVCNTFETIKMQCTPSAKRSPKREKKAGTPAGKSGAG